MRRNLENTHALALATHKEVVDMKGSMARFETTINLVSTQVEKATFLTLMQGTDISEFFPIETNHQLHLFMDRGHPEWENRKNEFFNFLLTIATNVKKGFARALIKSLFTRQFISTVKWPSPG